jgi:hypothetical protein
MKTQTEKVIQFREHDYNSEVSNITANIGPVQKVAHAYTALQLPKLKSIEDLRALIQSPAAYVERIITAGIETAPIKIGGVSIPFSHKKIFDTLDIPNLDALTTLCTEAKRIALNYYSFNGKTVSLDAAKIESLKTNYSFVARTKQEQELCTAALNIATALEAYNRQATKVNAPAILEHRTIGKLFYLHPDGDVKLQDEFLREIFSALA